MPDYEVLEIHATNYVPDPWKRTRLTTNRLLPPEGKKSIPCDFLEHGLLLRGPEGLVFLPWHMIGHCTLREKPAPKQTPQPKQKAKQQKE